MLTGSSTTPHLPYVDAQAIAGAVSWSQATDALEQALLDGYDPANSAARAIVDVSNGQLLLMPAETEGSVGVKLSTVAPNNPEHGLPRVQALYVLLDHETLTPVSLMDGTALTTLRTSAMSAVAVKHLATPDARHLVVFGSGPQAWGHVQALRAVRPIAMVTVVGRDRARAGALASRVLDSGLEATVGSAASVGAADIVVCATTASEPLFDSLLLKPNACVVAVGSHDAGRRELEAALLARATSAGGVVVETSEVALREAGDVILAIDEGAVSPDQLIDIASVVSRNEPTAGVSVFKSVGMGWQDLVVAREVFDRVGIGRDGNDE